MLVKIIIFCPRLGTFFLSRWNVVPSLGLRSFQNGTLSQAWDFVPFKMEYCPKLGILLNPERNIVPTVYQASPQASPLFSSSSPMLNLSSPTRPWLLLRAARAMLKLFV
jgi:hypothetical protein